MAARPGPTPRRAWTPALTCRPSAASTATSRTCIASRTAPRSRTCSGRSTTAASTAAPMAACSGSRSPRRSPAASASPVAAHPRDPQRAWFVPAHSDAQRMPVDGRMVVNETRDGGRSFESLGDGLPPHDAYHLVYRHGARVRGRRQRRSRWDRPPAGCGSASDAGARVALPLARPAADRGGAVR